MNKTIIYYSHGGCDSEILSYCQNNLKKSAGDIPIISVTHSPLDFGLNFVIKPQKPSILCMYQQILIGLQNAKPGIIYLAEHDVLYPEGYFDKTYPLLTYLGINVYFLNKKGFVKRDNPICLSTLTGERDFLIRAFTERIAYGLIEGTSYTWSEIGRSDPYNQWLYAKESSLFPVVDIRHGRNYTGPRGLSKPNLLEEVPYWGRLEELKGLL